MEVLEKVQQQEKEQPNDEENSQRADESKMEVDISHIDGSRKVELSKKQHHSFTIVTNRPKSLTPADHSKTSNTSSFNLFIGNERFSQLRRHQYRYIG